MTPLTSAALRATMRPAPRMPSYIGSCAVVADLHDVYSRIPGTLTAAVYEVPDRRQPGHAPSASLWVVACHPHPTDPRRRVWTEGLIGEL